MLQAILYTGAVKCQNPIIGSKHTTIISLTLFIVGGGEGAKKKRSLPKEEVSECGEKSARSRPVGAGARTRDLLHARGGSPVARHRSCLDK